MSRETGAEGPPSESDAPTLIPGGTRPESREDLSPGQRLGRHLIERELGRGGMGVVWSARDERLDRRVALKSIGRVFAHEPTGLERFVREARLLASLNHPSLATVHDLLWHDERPLLVMELLEGEDLARRLARGPLGLEETLRVGIQVASALGAAHERNIVHRDLKPANVQLLPSGLVKVLDFGLAHVWRGPGAEHEAGLAGTPAYMSPEQAQCEPLDARSDLFSLGLVLQECLTVRRAEVERPTDARFARGERSAIDWSEIDPEPPSGVKRLIAACLEPDREDRPATAAEVGKLLEVELRQVDGDREPAIARRRHFLPAESDAFVGRTSELASLAQHLSEGTRLLTLLGPGGTGKTRLVTRHAWSTLDDHPGGAWFCDLSEVRGLEGVTQAVAAALDVPLGQGDAVAQLGHSLRGRGPCLIVLDNFEQVVGQAATTVGAWLEQAEEARFIVTSRVLLDLPAETVLPVEPLAVDGAAIELFERRARAKKPSFSITDENREQVHEIVRRLDGLPLAIELAAARLRVLSPTALLSRLDDRFRLLTGPPGAGARQATLRAAIDWSWNLLEPWEQAALAQLAVCEGGFNLEAAEAVLDLSRWDEAPWALDVVQSLVDKSLLRTWSPVLPSGRQVSDEPCFGTYASIQEHAAEKLRTVGAIPREASGPEAERAAFIRHGEHFALWGTEEALDRLHAHGGVERRRELELWLGNLVVACRRAVARGDGTTAVKTLAAAWAVLALGTSSTVSRLAEDVLTLESLTSGERARVLVASGHARQQAGRWDEARTLYEQGAALARAEGLQALEAHALGNLGVLRGDQGHADEARELNERALALHRQLGHRRFEGAVLVALGNLDWGQGRPEAARESYEQALVLLQAEGDRRLEGRVLGNLAIVDAERGTLDEARALFEQALAIAREVGDRRREGVVLGNLGYLHAQEGRHEDARSLQEQALEIHREVGHRRSEGVVLGNLGALQSELGRPDEALVLFEAALAIHREVGNPAFEGLVLGKLGELHLEQGRAEQALPCLNEGERLLREQGDLMSLGLLLSVRGRAAFEGGDEATARACLDEVTRLAERVEAGEDSELGRAVERLRARLENVGGS
ncbi:MAG: tetratricopeptide repeat protein [Acidobacteriota bacterium]